jgi:hypothetical protein
MGSKVIFFTTTGNQSYVTPADFVSFVSVEAIGSGSAGRKNATAAAGGGGGAYAKSTSVTGMSVGSTSYIQVGVGGTNQGAGAISWFNAASNANPTLVTQGTRAAGASAPSIGIGGAGGTVAGSIGDVRFSGGTGGNALSNNGGGGGAAGPGGGGGAGANGNGTGMGGGGSGATESAQGTNGSTSVGGTGGTGGASTGQTGGTGGASGANPGGTGTNGGGGGGSGGAAAGGNGSAGTSTFLSSAGVTAGPGGGGGGGNAATGATGGLYGAGGGGANGSASTNNGAQGIVILTYATAAVTRYWVGGTGTWNISSTANWSATSGGASGASAPGSGDTVIFNASSGTGTVTIGSTASCAFITCTAASGSLVFSGSSTLTILGATADGAINITSGSWSGYTGTLSINNTGFTTSLSIASGVSFGGSVTYNPTTSGTLSITANITIPTTRTFTLTRGTLDLTGAATGNFTLSCGLFNSNNSNTRVIAFGTGAITTTGSGTAFTTATATGLTYTGTPTVNISNNSATATTVTAGTTGGAATNALNFNFTTGTYALTLTSASVVNSLNFTGFTGTWAPSTATCTLYGNLTLVSGMTFTTGTGIFTFSGTSGVQTITSAGKTIGPITINNTGTSVQLVGNTTGGAIVFTTGTLDINSVTTSFTTLTCATGPSIISGGTLNCTSFTNTSGSTTIQSGTLNLSSIVTHTAGTVTLGTSGALTSANTYTFTAGSIVLGSNTLNCAQFSSSNSNVRSIDFGTGNITTTGSSTAWTTSVSTNLTFSGTPTVNISNNSATATTIAAAVSAAGTGFGVAPNFNITTGTYSLTISSGSKVKSLNFTGFTGTWAPGTGTCTFFADLTLVSGMTFTAGGNTWTFARNLPSPQVITSAGKLLNSITQTGASTIVQLAAGTTTLNPTATSGVYTLTNGTLDLATNNATLSCTSFLANNTNTRSIDFGSTGNISIANTTSGATLWSTLNATNFTYTGTSAVSINSQNNTQLIDVHNTSGTESNALNFSITISAGNPTLSNGSYFRSLTLAGGTYNPNTSITIFKDATLSNSAMSTAGTGPWTFAATSGTQTITSNGKSCPSIVQNNPGATVLLADNFSTNNSSTYTLTAGTLNANNQNFTTLGFISNNSNTRTITMGSGTWTISGAGNIWQLATTTGLTFNKDTANIVLSNTTTTARTFAGGGLTYNNLTIGGATGISTLTFTGNNTFNTLASTKTVAHTITLPAGGTTTVANWTIQGTAGNVVTLNSSSAGSQATLTKTGGGVISGIDYLSIQDSNATPGSTWYAGANSTNVSNNTGWIFTPYFPPNGNFFFFLT